MLISKTKKGVTIIEILVCIVLFIIVLGYLNQAIFALNKAKVNIIKEEKFLEAMEVVFENLKINIEYDEYQEMKRNNRVFINNNRISVDELKNAEIKSYIQDKIPTSSTYLQVEIEEYEKGVLLVNLIIVEYDNRKCVGSFYKGDYFWCEE